jgi:hypothetical protein
MAPSAAICITSWQPFADGVGLGGRHRERVASREGKRSVPPSSPAHLRRVPVQSVPMGVALTPVCRVETRQRAKTAAPVVLDDRQSLHRCWHNCWHNRERRLAAEKFGGEARGSRLHRRCLGRGRGPQSGDCRLLGSNGCAAHFSVRRAATGECGTCDGHAEGCHEQDLHVFRHDHLLGLSLT